MPRRYVTRAVPTLDRSSRGRCVAEERREDTETRPGTGLRALYLSRRREMDGARDRTEPSDRDGRREKERERSRVSRKIEREDVYEKERKKERKSDLK